MRLEEDRISRRSPKLLKFSASSSFEEKPLFFEFTDDSINEYNEGFLMLIRIDEANSHPEDVANIQYLFDGVALVVIVNDDGKDFLLPRNIIKYQVQVLK